MTVFPGVYTQFVGEAGDIDDCWVYATIWAKKAADPGARVPTLKQFRAEAGDPDDGNADGGSLDEVHKGSKGSWPGEVAVRFKSTNFDRFIQYLKNDRTASLAVNSARLPSRMQFGFKGAHQVGVGWDDTNFVVANPLAKGGSPPLRITLTELERAATSLYAGGEVRAVLFPFKEAPTLKLTNVQPARGTARLTRRRDVYRVRDSYAATRDEGTEYETVAHCDYGPNDGSKSWPGYLIVSRDATREAWVVPNDGSEYTAAPPPSKPYAVIVGGKSAGTVTLP